MTQHTAKNWNFVEAARRLLESPTNWENVEDAYQILASVVGGKSRNSHDALLAAAKMVYTDCNSGKYLSARAYDAITKAIVRAEEGAK